MKIQQEETRYGLCAYERHGYAPIRHTRSAEAGSSSALRMTFRIGCESIPYLQGEVHKETYRGQCGRHGLNAAVHSEPS
jgi:hypothetical protein